MAVPVPHRSPGSDTGSIVMALLFVLVGLSLTAVMTPMVVVQITGTRVDMARVHSLHAAQTGIDVALGQIRAATDPNSGLGIPTKLPCGPFSGQVNTGSSPTYQVTISYVATDPQGRWATTSPMTCPPATTPAYAILLADGVDGSATRSLRATYTFASTNSHLVGGPIHVFIVSGKPDLCLDAGSSNPPLGTQVWVRPCTAGGSPQQSFGYYTDLSLVLVPSKTTYPPNGLCIDAGAAQVSGAAVTLKNCSATAPYYQRWGFTDNANFSGTKSDMTGTNLCIDVTTADQASPLVLGSCNHVNDRIGVFSPESSVGAGAAGMPIVDSLGTWRQLVNFQQFGRCLDVPYFDVTSAFLIAWPCKQGVGNVGTNQKWSLPASGHGQIRVYDGTSAYYCVKSPGTIGTTAYPNLTPCSTATGTNTQWTVVGNSTGNWNTDYWLVDSSGKCLAAKDESLGDYLGPGYHISKMIMAVCSSNALQKWNAPPNTVQPPPLTDIAER
jgi:hypothetical protein